VARGPRKSEIRPKISINSVDKSRMWGWCGCWHLWR
jgi:hypothetical protein